MPKIIINDLTDVTVDGSPQGGVVDMLFHAANAGDEGIRAPMLDALLDREKAMFGAAEEAISSAKSERDAARAELAAKAKAQTGLAAQARAALSAFATEIADVPVSPAAKKHFDTLLGVLATAEMDDRERAVASAQAAADAAAKVLKEAQEALAQNAPTE